MFVASWNVNSIRIRLPHVLAWLDDWQPDVLCLQELKCTAEQFPTAEFEAAGYTAVVAGQKTYNGVAVLARRPPDATLSDLAFDEQARLAAARFGDMWVISAYMPNGEVLTSPKFAYKLDWLAHLADLLPARFDLSGRVVLAGDFNVAPDDRDVVDPAWWADSVLCAPAARAAAARIRALGFDDTFRRHEAGAGYYSWWDYRQGSFQKNKGLRIDHVWATPAARTTDAGIDRGPRALPQPSDHAPVWARFAD